MSEGDQGRGQEAMPWCCTADDHENRLLYRLCTGDDMNQMMILSGSLIFVGCVALLLYLKIQKFRRSELGQIAGEPLRYFRRISAWLAAFARTLCR